MGRSVVIVLIVANPTTYEGNKQVPPGGESEGRGQGRGCTVFRCMKGTLLNWTAASKLEIATSLTSNRIRIRTRTS